MDQPGKSADHIELSSFTKALLENLNNNKKKQSPFEGSKLYVSQTASFFAIAYEKLRNAVEYRESHLIRRAAIERILRRRLALNPEGKGEAENLLRELLWARYFPNESLGTEDVERVQEIMDKYYGLKNILQKDKNNEEKGYISQFLFELLTCEIEETLSPYEAQQSLLFTFFIYQVLKDKLKIENLSDQQKNDFFYVALEKSFNKSDVPYLRFHLFILSHERLSKIDLKNDKDVEKELFPLFKKIDGLIRSPQVERLRRFVKNQMPPFKILFELCKKYPTRVEQILEDRSELWKSIEELSKEKYAQTRSKLTGLAVKAIIYIFLTKMIFALLLEYPLSKYFYGEADYFALTINSLFPPALMFVIVAFARVPGDDNTKRLYQRVIDIIDSDRSFEKSVSFVARKRTVRRPVLIFFFTVFYSLTFLLTFYFLYKILNLLRFNLVSQLVFVFFVSLVTFFGYRIIQIAKEYQVREGEGFFRPFIDLFFLPILSLGKFLSRGIAKLNFFGAVFDYVIEAPLKIIVDVVEEWIRFVRTKREEIE